LKFWRFDKVSVDSRYYFDYVCAETAIFELLAIILTTTLDSATPISHTRRTFRRSQNTYSLFWPLFGIPCECTPFLLPI